MSLHRLALDSGPPHHMLPRACRDGSPATSTIDCSGVSGQGVLQGARSSRLSRMFVGEATVSLATLSRDLCQISHALAVGFCSTKRCSARPFLPPC